MRRVITVLGLLIFSAIWNAQAQALNCQAAYTKVEKAICGSPQLSELHTRFSDAAGHSVSRGAVSARAVMTLKDQVARACRSTSNLETCLAEEISEALELLGNRLADSQQTPAQVISSSESEQLALLLQRLVTAEKRFHNDGAPEELVVTLLAMLQVYSERALVSDTAEYESRAIHAKLMAGCGDLGTRGRWNKALQAYGRACPINQVANADY